MANKTNAPPPSTWALLLGQAELPGQHPEPVDGSPSSIRRLESVMLFPGKNDVAASLRNIYCHDEMRNALSSELQVKRRSNRVRRTAANPEKVAENSSELVIEPRIVGPEPHPVLMMPDDLAMLVTSSETLCGAHALRNSKDGQIAGALLTYLRLMDIKRLERMPSLPKTMDIALSKFRKSKGDKNQPDDDRRPRTHFTPKTIGKAWSHFAPVAHLWAAYLALNRFQVAPVQAPLSKTSLADLIAIAEIYAAWARDFFSRQRSETRKADYPSEIWRFKHDRPSAIYRLDKLPSDKIALKHVVSATT